MNVKNLLNQKFGRLTVKKYIGTHGTSAYWECICDCGNKHKADSKCLKNGGVKSCGCLQNDMRKQMQIAKRGTGQGPINLLYHKYSWAARKRNLQFDISKEEFKILILSECFYYNSKPIKVLYYENNYYPEILANGIDRIDNDLGYIFKNCVPCCKQCNQAKSNLLVKDFYKWIKKVYRKKYGIS